MSKTTPTSLICSTPCLHSLILLPTIIFWLTHTCSSFSANCPLHSLYLTVVNSPLGFTAMIMGLPILSMSLSMFYYLDHLHHPSRITTLNFVTSFIFTTISFLIIAS